MLGLHGGGRLRHAQLVVSMEQRLVCSLSPIRLENDCAYGTLPQRSRGDPRLSLDDPAALARHMAFCAAGGPFSRVVVVTSSETTDWGTSHDDAPSFLLLRGL